MKRLVLVTGANRGIGLATVEKFAREGHATILSGRDEEVVFEKAEHFRREGLDVQGLPLDVSSIYSIRNALASIETANQHVSVLVNNAAILVASSLSAMEEDDILASFTTNVLGPIIIIRHLVPRMVKEGYGRIVNVSSNWGSFACGLRGPGAYGITKAALNAATLRVSRELPATIKINAMHPGWVRSRMGGENAPIDPRTAAETAYRLGTLGANGPTGRFFDNKVELGW